jgi:uncharacterized protein (TIGR00725 family)
VIAVVGGAGEDDPRILQASEHLGELLADEGWILVTGGGCGVMEAVSAGAQRRGGRVVGILPGSAPSDANPHVEIPIATGLGEARNAVIATAANAVVAVGGEYGTLSEIAHALKLRKPVLVLLSPWGSIPGTQVVESPRDAVDRLQSLV